jgi:hypothetical protein
MASVVKAMFAKLFFEAHQSNYRFVLITRVTSYRDKFEFSDETKSLRRAIVEIPSALM